MDFAISVIIGLRPDIEFVLFCFPSLAVLLVAIAVCKLLVLVMHFELFVDVGTIMKFKLRRKLVVLELVKHPCYSIWALIHFVSVVRSSFLLLGRPFPRRLGATSSTSTSAATRARRAATLSR
jgi:hypothetical protein